VRGNALDRIERAAAPNLHVDYANESSPSAIPELPIRFTFSREALRHSDCGWHHPHEAQRTGRTAGSAGMFSYILAKQRVPNDRPLRTIPQLVDGLSLDWHGPALRKPSRSCAHEGMKRESALRYRRS
jgi:hypothetical protein